MTFSIQTIVEFEDIIHISDSLRYPCYVCFCHIIYAMLYILYSFSEKYNQKHNRQFKSGIPIFCMNILQLSCNYKVKLYPTLQSISKNIIFLFSLNKQKKIIINNNNIFNTKLLFIYNIYRSQKDILLL